MCHVESLRGQSVKNTEHKRNHLGLKGVGDEEGHKEQMIANNTRTDMRKREEQRHCET